MPDTAPLHLVVMGVSGTGKSTVAAGLAAALGLYMVEGDDLHPAGNVARMAAGVPLTDEDRRPWLDRLAAELARRQAAGRGTVLTCSALRRRYRDVLRAGAAGGAVFFVHLHAPREVLERRVGGRARRGEHFMPASLLPSQLATLEPLEADEDGVRIDVSAPPEVVLGRALAAIRSAVDGPRSGPDQ